MDYDVFISYASEDKDNLARPLAQELDKYLKVWFDDFVIRLGDDIRETIFRGLSNSRFGIVIFSPSFFKKKKGWTKYELDLLLSIESENENVVILPIVHQIEFQKRNEYSSLLEGKRYISSKEGLTKIVDEVLRAIGRPELNVPYEPRFDQLIQSENQLYGRLLKMRKVVTPYLRKIPNSIYAMQSEEHARQVLGLVCDLFYPILDTSLTKYELFLLASLCLVHDVGMHPRRGLSDEEIFANHHQFSSDYVYSNLLEQRVIDNKTANILASLCLVHNLPINRASNKLTALNTQDMSLTLIYGLFKIADMLEIQIQPGSILRMSPDVIMDSVVGDFDIDSRQQTIRLTCAPDADTKYFTPFVSLLEERFQELKDISFGTISYKVLINEYKTG